MYMCNIHDIYGICQTFIYSTWYQNQYVYIPNAQALDTQYQMHFMSVPSYAIKTWLIKLSAPWVTTATYLYMN